MILQAAGYVLAGGRSTRMGRDKALLGLDGEPLITRALRRLQGACVEIAIAGGTPELASYGRLVVDGRPGCGPLGGIVSALEQTCFEWNLFVPVDVPFIPPQVWIALLDAAQTAPEDASCIMSRADGQVQPLCAVYARRSAPVLRQELDAGRWKVTAAASAAGLVLYVDFIDGSWFRNVNTPAEFDQARAD